MISKIPTRFEKPRQRLPTILVKRADQWGSIPQSDFLWLRDLTSVWPQTEVKRRYSENIPSACCSTSWLFQSLAPFWVLRFIPKTLSNWGPLAEDQEAWPGGICQLPLSWSLQHSLTVTYGPGAHEWTIACSGVRQFRVVRGADLPSPPSSTGHP